MYNKLIKDQILIIISFCSTVAYDSAILPFNVDDIIGYSRK